MPRTSFFVDGLNVYRFAAEAPRYAVLILPGTGGHGGCYDKYGEAHSGSGVEVFAMDFPGHGKSRGNPGQWTMRDCLNDINTVADHVKAETGLPLFLLGSSQGSGFAYYALNGTDSISGAITMCLSSFHLDPLCKVIAPLCSEDFKKGMEFFRGSLQVDLKKLLRLEETYGSIEVTARLINDPDMTWFYDLISYHEYLTWQPDVPDAENTKPMLVTIGENDPFMPPALIKTLAKQIAGPITFKEFNDAPHQLMLERTEDFMATVDGWVAEVS